MNEIKDKNLKFFGGKLGAWVPLGSMMIFMLILVVTDHVSLKIFWTAGFFALCLSFILVKDKKAFSDVVVTGLTDKTFSTLVMIFFLAGILSYNLRQSGLIDGLLWACTKLGANGALIPAITFIICAIIGTACGTSGGTVAAATPIMLPLGVSLGVNPGLILGAIASGAFFGDNLAPISDTTISSATVMEKPVPGVVKSRLPFSLIGGAVAFGLFVFLGITTTVSVGTPEIANPDAAKTLVMLTVPVIMVIMMLMGQELVSVLLICDMFALALNIGMGFIPVNSVFSTSGPIVAGIESMLSIVCFEVFLFALLALTKKSGVFDELLDTVTNSCKTEKSAEVTTCVMVVLATCATAINVAAILIVGPIANKLFRNFNLDRNRGANFLDGLACATTGLIPYNATMMTMFNLAVGTGVLSETFQITDAIVYNFHCMMLMVLFFLAAITGIGKRKEKNED